jgi:hypothetical protein
MSVVDRFCTEHFRAQRREQGPHRRMGGGRAGAFGAGVDGGMYALPARSETPLVDCPVSDDAASYGMRR